MRKRLMTVVAMTAGALARAVPAGADGVWVCFSYERHPVRAGVPDSTWQVRQDVPVLIPTGVEDERCTGGKSYGLDY